MKKLNKSKKLCDRLPITEKQLEYVNSKLPAKYQYKKDPYGNFRFDWGLVGGELAKWLFEPYYASSSCLKFDKEKTFLMKYFSLHHPLPIVYKQAEVTAWVNWMSIVAFPFNRMLQTINKSDKTNSVLLRIAVAKLNKINISMEYSAFLFDNLIKSNRLRREAIMDYYCTIVMELPF